jgi:hypothetical protein
VNNIYRVIPVKRTFHAEQLSAGGMDIREVTATNPDGLTQNSRQPVNSDETQAVLSEREYRRRKSDPLSAPAHHPRAPKPSRRTKKWHEWPFHLNF